MAKAQDKAKNGKVVSNGKTNIDCEIIKAISEIREKKKRPCEDTMITHSEKKGLAVEHRGVTSALIRMEEARVIENRTKNGEDSYFVRNSDENEEAAEVKFIN